MERESQVVAWRDDGFQHVRVGVRMRDMHQRWATGGGAAVAVELEILTAERCNSGWRGFTQAVRTCITPLMSLAQVCLGGLLKRGDCRALESQIGLEILSDFPNQALEWKFPDQQLRALLVLPNLAKGDSSGAKRSEDDNELLLHLDQML